MTGRINFSPEAQEQLNALDDWITEKASVMSRSTWCRRSSITSTASSSWSSLLLAEHATTFDRTRTITSKKQTLIAYEVDESSGDLVVNILGLFHGGQGWEAVLRDESTQGHGSSAPATGSRTLGRQVTNVRRRRWVTCQR